MPVTLPWVQKKRDTEDSLDARRHNTSEENRLLDLAQERFELARSEKTDHRGRPLNDKFREIDKFYKGEQWKGSVPPEKSTPVVNFTFSLVESIVPRLTDNRPEILVMARRDPMSTEFAKSLTQAQQHLWYVNRMERKTPGFVRMALKYGTSIMKAIWNPDKYDGMGEVEYSVVHPGNFFPDPRAYEIEDMDYCFVSVPKSVEYFLRTWPEKGHLVNPTIDVTISETTGASDKSSKEERAPLMEYWFKDEEGNVCVMYYSGHVVLNVIGGKYDESNEPVYRHNRFPFAKYVDYEADKEFWGIGEIEIVMLLQRLINNFESQIIDNTRLMANSEWVVNKVQSGLKEEDSWVFRAKPGNVIFTHNGGVERVPGTPIPRHVPEHMERLIFAMEQILGIHDVVQGRKPAGVRAASAIIALQEAANVRVRQKAKNLEYCLQDVADMGNWLVLEKYDEPRRIRISGSEVPFTLNVRESLDSLMVNQAAMAGMIEEGVDPSQVPEEDMGMLYDELKFPEFDVEVKVGPSVPYSQALLYEQAKEFYQLGIIDQQAVLEITNFPGKEEILARMQQGMMEAQQEEERMGERTFGGI